MPTHSVERQVKYPGDTGVYVRTDVRDAEGDPWEVKNADSIHAMQSAHGQADFQRFLSSKVASTSAQQSLRRSALWLYTRHGRGGKGHKHYDLLKALLAESPADARRRYKRLILVHMLSLENARPVRASDVRAEIIEDYLLQ